MPSDFSQFKIFDIVLGMLFLEPEIIYWEKISMPLVGQSNDDETVIKPKLLLVLAFITMLIFSGVQNNRGRRQPIIA